MDGERVGKLILASPESIAVLATAPDKTMILGD